MAYNINIRLTTRLGESFLLSLMMLGLLDNGWHIGQGFLVIALRGGPVDWVPVMGVWDLCRVVVLVVAGDQRLSVSLFGEGQVGPAMGGDVEGLQVVVIDDAIRHPCGVLPAIVLEAFTAEILLEPSIGKIPGRGSHILHMFLDLVLVAARHWLCTLLRVVGLLFGIGFGGISWRGLGLDVDGLGLFGLGLGWFGEWVVVGIKEFQIVLIDYTLGMVSFNLFLRYIHPIPIFLITPPSTLILRQIPRKPTVILYIARSHTEQASHNIPGVHLRRIRTRVTNAFIRLININGEGQATFLAGGAWTSAFGG